MFLAAATGAALAGAAQAQPTPDNLPRFQSTWQEVIKPNAGFWSIGVAQEFAYTAGPGGVTSVQPPSTNLIANVRQIYGPQTVNPPMVYLEIIDGIRNVTFVRANADTFTPIAGDRATYARASDWTRQAIVADPLVLGWQYQSFAAWQTGLGQPNGSMGATSFGNETGWAGRTTVPQTGQATFNGFMGAIYNDAVGQDRVVTADVGIQMNFAAHTADFATTNTRDRNGVALDDLNITGSFVGLPDFPQMFGSLTTARLQGTSSARFFGPAAEEFGGVFTLTPRSGQGLERLAGAFGSRQGAPAPPARFTSWSADLKPGATILASGPTVEVRPVGQGGYTDYGATYTAQFNAAGALSALQISGNAGAVGIAFGAGDAIAPLPSDQRFSAASKTGQQALIADPVKFGWDYQTFGAWQTTGSDNGFAVTNPGGFSTGAPTLAEALPPTGEVTFRGMASANYVRSTTDRSMVVADVRVDANFANRTAAFSTSEMRGVADGRVFSGTALTGIMTWNANQNRLNGSVRTEDARLNGAVYGAFYGPAVQEVGGVFGLGNGANERLAGAFGAKR